MDLKEFVRKQSVPVAASNLYNRAECFLLWVLPLSAIVPAVWRTDGARRGHGKGFVAAFALGVGLILLAAIGLPARRTPWWIVELGRLAPLGLVAMGVEGAAVRGAVVGSIGVAVGRRRRGRGGVGGLAAVVPVRA